jgi:DNA-binding transcriptional MerR regulator
MTQTPERDSVKIPEKIYFRIGDVARVSGLKPHVIRYWETEFPMIIPEKSVSGQRVYRRRHLETVLLIKHLLYQERYSIEGARLKIQALRKKGDLKSFREEKVLTPPPLEDGSVEEKTKRMHVLFNELQSLVSQPVNAIFKHE